MSMTITVRCECDFCDAKGDGHVDVEQRSDRTTEIDSRVKLPAGWTWKKWGGSDVLEPMCSKCTKERT